MQDDSGNPLTHTSEPNGSLRSPEVRQKQLPSDLTAYSWVRIAQGIALAGAAYAMVLAFLQYAFMFVFLMSGQASSSNQWWERFALLVGTMVASAIQLLVYGISGLLWAGIVSAVTLPIVYLFVWSLKIRGNVIWLGAFCGGLVGFFSTLPLIVFFAIDMPQNSADLLWAVAVVLLMGPCLTTVIGQIGGSWGGRRSARYAAQLAWQRTHGIFPGGTSPHQSSPAESGPAETDSSRQARFQFRVWHLLWIAFWLSVLLTVIRLCGIPFELILPLLAGWTLYQAGTLWVGGKTVRRFAAWRRGRLARST